MVSNRYVVKKLFTYAILTVIGIVVLYLMAKTREPMLEQLRRLNIREFNQYHTYMMLCGVAFGILLGWKNIVSLIGNRIKVNWLIVPTLLMLIPVFYPFHYWMLHIKMGSILYTILSSLEVSIALSIVTGLFLTLSLSTKKHE